MKKVLILGAGLVTRPGVRYLLEEAGYAVKVASRTEAKAKAVVGDHPNGSTEQWVTEDAAGLERMIQESDLAVSLLPAPFHPMVAELCIKHKKPMVTTSYVGEPMQALHDGAKDAGVILMNECGLDPGIDHMSAKAVIDEAHEKGGKVVGFKSYCGGLPALEADTTPWRYKFSWSPRAVLTAASNDGKFLRDGEEVYIPGHDLFAEYHLLDIPEFATFEAYTNRDCLHYLETYGVPEAKTMFRGTLRNVGHCETFKHLADLKLLDKVTEYDLKGKTYRGFLAELLGVAADADLAAVIREKLNLPVFDILTKKMEWLGLFTDEPIGLDKGMAIDVLAVPMQKKLELKAGERDLVVMHHEFTIEYPDKKVLATSTLVQTGDADPDGDSAMAKTVSLPAAMAVHAILEGDITETGVHIPVQPVVYRPILKKLEPVGIIFKETETVIG